MPPITSPRRTALHPHAAPVPIPVPGGMAGLPGMPALSGASTSTHASTPPSTGTSPGSASFGSVGAAAAATAPSSSAMGRAHSQTQVPHPHPHHNAGTHPHSTPYMVALAGWPEPVFVAEAWDTRKRSRPTSPVGFRDVRDGVACPPPAALVNSLPAGGATTSPNPQANGAGASGASSGASAGSRSPAYPRASGMARTPSAGIDVVPGLRSRGSSPPGFPTSAARDVPAPRPNSSGDATPTVSSSGGTPPSLHRPSSSGGGGGASDMHGPLSGPLARLALGDRSPKLPAKAGSSPSLAARTVRRNMEKFGFADPRYGLNAAVIGRGAGRGPLRVAPAWTSAAPGGAPYPSHERDSGPSLRGRPPTSATRTGVARAAPEVYPPTKGAATPFVTQVYPRDPDRFFAVPATAAPRSGTHTGSSSSGAGSPAGDDDGEPAPKAARRATSAEAEAVPRASAERESGAVANGAVTRTVPPTTQMDVDA